MYPERVPIPGYVKLPPSTVGVGGPLVSQIANSVPPPVRIRVGRSFRIRRFMSIEFPRRSFETKALEARKFSRFRRDIRIIRGCAIGILAIALLAASVGAGALLAPTAIAGTLALVLAPVARTIERLGIPTGAAAVLTVVATVSCLAASATALAPDVSNWLKEVPAVVQSIEHKLQPLARRLAPFERLASHGGQNSPAASVAPAAAAVALPDGVLVAAARTAPGIIENGVYITILTIFLLACRKRYTSQLILMPRSLGTRLRIARISRDIRSRVSRYLFTLSLINIGLAAITTVCFSIAGIANPVLWGIAFGLLNYVPVLGPTSAIVFAALVGFASADTITGALAPPLILLALNTVEANLVQPWLLSRRIVISPVAIFLTVVGLVWMWGPIAAITAVPILISFHTVAIHVPALRPIALLMASEEGAIALWQKAEFIRKLRTVPRMRPPQALH
jgi:predicted PurR-regulated permease PerM